MGSGLLVLTIAAALASASCTRSEPPPRASPANVPPPPSVAERVDGPEPARIRALVLDSHTWNRATRTALQKLADCRAVSEREDSTHRKGEKFHLYVKGERQQMIAYQDGKPLAPGTVIVKRTFTPRRIDGGVVMGMTAEEDGDLTAFFLMENVAGKNPAGGDWLYATTRPDGTVLRAGALADCMACHEKRREQGFLFGLDYRYGTLPQR